jgi:hypothetical protein
MRDRLAGMKSDRRIHQLLADKDKRDRAADKQDMT